MPFEFICYGCGYRVISPSKNIGELEMIKHYYRSHNRTFKNVVFDYEEEFIDLKFHKERKELVIFTNIISWTEYEEMKMIHKIEPLPKTKIL